MQLESGGYAKGLLAAGLHLVRVEGALSMNPARLGVLAAGAGPTMVGCQGYHGILTPGH